MKLLNKAILSVCALLMLPSILPAEEMRVEREAIEWCDIRIPSAATLHQPRVLLVGDSITQAYYNSVSSQLREAATCSKFATSACVGDPAFLLQLNSLITQYDFAVVHFNNGLHGFGYTEEEYGAGYEKALKAIKEYLPSATIILTLTTPLQEGSSQSRLNPRVDERNQIVLRLAEAHDCQVNDLHAISKGHTEYYRDPYHYKEIAVTLQAKQVSQCILGSLKP